MHIRAWDQARQGKGHIMKVTACYTKKSKSVLKDTINRAT